MRNMFALILLALLPSLGAYAGEAGESVRYITLTGGRVYAIAEEHIKGENQSDNVMTLSLEGGEEWSYSLSDVVSDDNQYEGTTAELLSFAFTHEDNDQVYKDVEATITEEDGTIVVKADVPVIGKRLRPSFTTSEASGLYLDGKRIVSGKDHFRFTSPIEFTLAQDNHYIYEVDDAGNGEFVPLGKPCRVAVKYLTDHATGTYKIPTVYITFGEDTTRWDENNWIGMKLPDGTNTKEEWIEGCTFLLDGAGVWPDIAKVEGCEVRGRGNSSWSWSHNSKNPFRIKLPKKNKQSPFNLTEDRQWVFIANKQNGSMTSNSIAQKIAAMVDGEALCHMIPVDVYINGHYRGSYCFTEKIGIADNSVAIDEATGCLLELDDYFDETFKFRDDAYNLPVNVKDPDFSEEDDERKVTFEAIQESFNSLTATLHSGGDISAKIDMESWAKFWLVNDLVRNVETHHPKSCYIFNENPVEGEKWKFGPAWDFDWAFGYEETSNYFIYGAEEDLFSRRAGQNKAGYQFYNALRKSQAGRKAYQEEWNKFMEEDRLGELMEYIDDYTEFASLSIKHNNDADVSEKNSTDYEDLAERSKDWLTRRANYIYNSIQSGDTPDEGEVTPQTFLVDGIRYSVLSNSEVEVTYLNERPNYGSENYTEGNITIPATIEYNNVTYTVTRIGDAAFWGCSGLTSVTIPNSVESIGSDAFWDCSGLTSVTIPNSVKSIEAWAFRYCYGLTSITIPNSVTDIGYNAFWGCSDLTSIIVEERNSVYDSRNNSNAIIETATSTLIAGCKQTVIPNSVTSIGESAFGGCSGLTSITIPNSVTSIGESAFLYCTGLTSITIPNSVTSIGQYAFSDCIGLTSITLPNSVTSIGDGAFYDCYGLTSVTIPNSVAGIGESAFKNCSGLTSIVVEDGNPVYDSRNNCNAIIETSTNTLHSGCKTTIIPNSVVSIGNVAFSGCSDLASVTIPNSVTSIGSYAFEGCTSLTLIRIPKSVTSLGSGAFAWCPALASIDVDSENSVYDSRNNCNAVIETATNALLVGCKTTRIPNGVTSIGPAAFLGCSSLTSIYLPDKLKRIHGQAFWGCEMLSDVTSLSDNIEIGYECFSNISPDAVLHVNNGTKSRYISNGWGEYFSNILEDGVPNEVITNKCVKIGTAQSSMTPNKWYFVHNTRISGIEITTNFSEPGETIKDYGGLVSDCGIGSDVLMSETSVISALKSEALPNMERHLVRFVPVEGKDDAFRVEFATGNWLKANRESHRSHFTVTPNAEGATIFNFYLIDGNEHGRFGWNVYDMRNRVDNDGAGHTLSLWEDGELTGVTEGNNVWQIYDVVVEHTEVVIPDGSVDNYAADADQHCDVLSYMRTLPNKQWNALYVPFKIPYSSLSGNYDVAYVNSIHSYDNDENGQIDKLTMEVVKIKDGTLKANHPYLIRAKDEESKAMNLVLKNTTLCATECVTLDCSSVYTKYEITGTYSTMTSADLEGSLVITTSGAWQRLSSSSRLKPFRFYLTISPRDGSPVELEESALSRINIRVLGEDGDATGIEEGMSETPANASPVYDLSGRRVKVPTKGGVYIVNGKKVVF